MACWVSLRHVLVQAMRPGHGVEFRGVEEVSFGLFSSGTNETKMEQHGLKK